MIPLLALCAIAAGFTPQGKTNFFETPEFQKHRSVVAALDRYSLSFTKRTLGAGGGDQGSLTVSGERMLIAYKEMATIWDGRRGAVLDRFSGKRTTWYRKPPMTPFGLFYLPPDEKLEWPSELDAQRLTREVKDDSGKVYIEVGWRVFQGWVDTSTTFEYWFSATTGLMSEAIVTQAGMTQPSRHVYRLTWDLDPVIPTGFPVLPGRMETTAATRFSKSTFDPEQRDGYGTLRVTFPKGVRGRIEVRTGTGESWSSLASEVRCKLKPGGCGVFLEFGAFQVNIRSRWETVVSLGAIENRTGRTLKLESGVSLRSGSVSGMLPGSYTTVGPKPRTFEVVAGKITVIR
jgi:hypothetical protein